MPRSVGLTEWRSAPSPDAIARSKKVENRRPAELRPGKNATGNGVSPCMYPRQVISERGTMTMPWLESKDVAGARARQFPRCREHVQGARSPGTARGLNEG